LHPKKGAIIVEQDIYIGSMSTLSFMPIIKNSAGDELIKLMSMSGAFFATNGEQNAHNAGACAIGKWYNCMFDIDLETNTYTLI